MTLRAALKWCDEMIVFLHACTDESSDIIHRIAVLYRDRVTIIGDSLNPMWDEMQHRQRMLEMARQPEIGATHIAIIDADEIVVGTVLVPLPGPGQMLMLPGYNLRGGIDFYHANGIWGEPLVLDDLRGSAESWLARGRFSPPGATRQRILCRAQEPRPGWKVWRAASVGCERKAADGKARALQSHGAVEVWKQKSRFDRPRVQPMEIEIGRSKFRIPRSSNSTIRGHSDLFRRTGGKIIWTSSSTWMWIGNRGRLPKFNGSSKSTALRSSPG